MMRIISLSFWLLVFAYLLQFLARPVAVDVGFTSSLYPPEQSFDDEYDVASHDRTHESTSFAGQVKAK